MGKIFKELKKTCEKIDNIESDDVSLCIAMDENEDGMTYKYSKQLDDLATLIFGAIKSDPELLVATMAAVEKVKENNFKDINAN